jgi:hypothetical protein
MNLEIISTNQPSKYSKIKLYLSINESYNSINLSTNFVFPESIAGHGVGEVGHAQVPIFRHNKQ